MSSHLLWAPRPCSGGSKRTGTLLLKWSKAIPVRMILTLMMATEWHLTPGNRQANCMAGSQPGALSPTVPHSLSLVFGRQR
jgi:hypothetical protein